MKSEYRTSLGDSAGECIWTCGERKNVVNLWEVGRAGTWGTDVTCDTINGNVNVGWKWYRSAKWVREGKKRIVGNGLPTTVQGAPYSVHARRSHKHGH